MSKSEQFAKMYQSVIKDPRINDKDFRILAYIKSFSGNWQARQTHIAKELGISISTVIRSFNRLDDAGYLSYERRETKAGSERRKVKMHHKPKHWEGATTKEPSARSAKRASQVTLPPITHDTAGPSKLTDLPGKSDPAPLSNLTSNEELNEEKYYKDRVTESYCAEKAVPIADADVQAIWRRYNTAPEGYIQIDPMNLVAKDANLAVRMLDDMLEARKGLLMAPGQKTVTEMAPGQMMTIAVDAQYYLQQIRMLIDDRDKGTFPPKFAWEIHDAGYALYVRPDLYEAMKGPSRP